MNVKVEELMPFVKEASSIALDWTIGFVRPVQVSSGKGPPSIDAGLGGSGILVEANGHHAILTADHVIEHLPNEGPVGLVLLDRRGLIDHRFLLDMGYLNKVRVARGVDEALGPDLALLSLTQDDVARLKAKKSFYGLSSRKQPVLSLPPPKELSPWIIQGFIDEWTERRQPLPDTTLNFTFKSMCGPVRLCQTRELNGFDYFSIAVNCGPERHLPTSFGGASGCGVWHLMFEKTENVKALKLSRLILGGIAFYQSQMNENRRFIECHGVRSIYEKVESVLAQGLR